jgi:hypothetical protein
MKILLTIFAAVPVAIFIIAILYILLINGILIPMIFVFWTGWGLCYLGEKYL